MTTTKITKSQLKQMIKEAILEESVDFIIKEQSQVGLRTSLAKVIKYLMKRQSSAVDQGEYYDIEKHLETLKKVAEVLQ